VNLELFPFAWPKLPLAQRIDDALIDTCVTTRFHHNNTTNYTGSRIQYHAKETLTFMMHGAV